MNYLAHLHLSRDTRDARIGSVLADFTHLPNARLEEAFGKGIAQGITAHRQIDAFTDTHDAVLEAVSLLFPRHRHAGRIIVDVLFDHYLSTHWARFSDVPRREFIGQCYALLRSIDPDDERFPERFRVFARRYAEYDVLASYHQVEGVGVALERVGRRVASRNTLHDTVSDIRLHYDALEKCFVRFYPQLAEFARAL
jgi:acyl carrier protein phosphodiesterase